MDLRRPAAVESSDEGENDEPNVSIFDDDADLHFGDRGNLINPFIMKWQVDDEDENEVCTNNLPGILYNSRK